METQTTQTVQPERILSEAGSSSPIATKADVVWPEEKRQRLLTFLARTEPAWKDEDHPELVELGTYGWVRSMREKNWRSPEVDGLPEAGSEQQ